MLVIKDITTYPNFFSVSYTDTEQTQVVRSQTVSEEKLFEFLKWLGVNNVAEYLQFQCNLEHATLAYIIFRKNLLNIQQN